MSGEIADPKLRSAWLAVQDRLRRSVPETTYSMWLQPLELLAERGETVLLTAPERTRTWVERRYLPVVARALSDELGRTVSVSIETTQTAPNSTHTDLTPNPSYTFDRFVIGEANHLAHAAALTVAEAPAEAYNPLFIHGRPGLGKTHLICAIANYLAVNAPGLNLRYTTAESFTSEFVSALKTSGIDAFKRRYRDLDVLLVDDVQFLQGKQSTEEELFHTFNALYEAGSQLVFTADRIPSQLSTLADRLRDRFEWGLIVAIEPPSLAVRQTVLNRLVREAGVEIQDRAALTLLASRVDTSIRQLHGTLTRLIAHASLTARPFNAALIESVLGPDDVHAKPAPLEIGTLLERVADSFSVPIAELIGPGRSKPSVRARQAAVLLAREIVALSLPEIGNHLGGRDHSTVHNALRRAEQLLEDDPDFTSQINSLRASLHSQAT